MVLHLSVFLFEDAQYLLVLLGLFLLLVLQAQPHKLLKVRLFLMQQLLDLPEYNLLVV